MPAGQEQPGAGSASVVADEGALPGSPEKGDVRRQAPTPPACPPVPESVGEGDQPLIPLPPPPKPLAFVPCRAVPMLENQFQERGSKSQYPGERAECFCDYWREPGLMEKAELVFDDCSGTVGFIDARANPEDSVHRYMWGGGSNRERTLSEYNWDRNEKDGGAEYKFTAVQEPGPSASVRAWRIFVGRFDRRTETENKTDFYLDPYDFHAHANILGNARKHVNAAGAIQFCRRGKILKINNNSGHFCHALDSERTGQENVEGLAQWLTLAHPACLSDGQQIHDEVVSPENACDSKFHAETYQKYPFEQTDFPPAPVGVDAAAPAAAAGTMFEFKEKLQDAGPAQTEVIVTGLKFVDNEIGAVIGGNARLMLSESDSSIRLEKDTQVPKRREFEGRYDKRYGRFVTEDSVEIKLNGEEEPDYCYD